MIFNMNRLKPSGPDDVRVDRATIYGNPYPITPRRSREQAISLYEAYARRRVVVDPDFRDKVKALRGKRLFCWCAPNPCHGEILKRICEELNR